MGAIEHDEGDNDTRDDKQGRGRSLPLRGGEPPTEGSPRVRCSPRNEPAAAQGNDAGEKVTESGGRVVHTEYRGEVFFKPVDGGGGGGGGGDL